MKKLYLSALVALFALGHTTHAASEETEAKSEFSLVPVVVSLDDKNIAVMKEFRDAVNASRLPDAQRSDAWIIDEVLRRIENNNRLYAMKNDSEIVAFVGCGQWVYNPQEDLSKLPQPAQDTRQHIGTIYLPHYSFASLGIFGKDLTVDIRTQALKLAVATYTSEIILPCRLAPSHIVQYAEPRSDDAKSLDLAGFKILPSKNEDNLHAVLGNTKLDRQIWYYELLTRTVNQ